MTYGQPVGTPPRPPEPPASGGPSWYQRRWVLATIVGVIIFIIGASIGAAGGKTKTKTVASPAVTTTATETTTMPVPGPTKTVATTTVKDIVKVTTTYTPPVVTAFAGDGTFLVNSQVAPGTYESDGPSTADGIGECSYSVNAKGSGIGAIIDNGNTSGQTVIQVPASAYTVMTQGCDPFHKVG